MKLSLAVAAVAAGSNYLVLPIYANPPELSKRVRGISVRLGNLTGDYLVLVRRGSYKIYLIELIGSIRGVLQLIL